MICHFHIFPDSYRRETWQSVKQRAILHILCVYDFHTFQISCRWETFLCVWIPVGFFGFFVVCHFHILEPSQLSVNTISSFILYTFVFSCQWEMYHTGNKVNSTSFLWHFHLLPVTYRQEAQLGVNTVSSFILFLLVDFIHLHSPVGCIYHYPWEAVQFFRVFFVCHCVPILLPLKHSIILQLFHGFAIVVQHKDMTSVWNTINSSTSLCSHCCSHPFSYCINRPCLAPSSVSIHIIKFWMDRKFFNYAVSVVDVI